MQPGDESKRLPGRRLALRAGARPRSPVAALRA
jgi:hypothetical protein